MIIGKDEVVVESSASSLLALISLSCTFAFGPKGCDKDLVKFDDMMGSTVDFTKFAKHCLKKDKITKANLEGPAFNLLKDQIDWVNPEGDICPYDLRKSLSLQGPPGRTTISVDFFFNKDLEYLKTGNKEKNLSKEGYDLNSSLGIHHWGPKRQQFYKARHTVTSLHIVYSRMKILSIIRLIVDKQLHVNDIEDMYLLYAQNKLHHLKGDEQTVLVTALCLFIRRIVLKKRVEDVQIGVKSYQLKLNITRPKVRCDGLDAKEPYTILNEPRGVVYMNKNNDKYLMRAVSYTSLVMER
ncbi:hypothetical protein Tco_0683161 [Tanacetum coccineum]|uniref:Uncharacterized protein n=1 Tax=Tanacetum coccineum TaxID=301880 RepID=A0ABQ4XUT4_9ASTR